MSKIVTNTSGKSSPIHTGVGMGVSLLFALSTVPLTGASAILTDQAPASNYYQYNFSSPMVSSNTNVNHNKDEGDDINLIILQNEDVATRSASEVTTSSITTNEGTAKIAEKSIVLPLVKTFEVELLIDFDESFSNSFAPEQVV